MSDCKHEAHLRRYDRYRMSPHAWAHRDRQAADHIADQRAEIDRLTRERDEAWRLFRVAMCKHAFSFADTHCGKCHGCSTADKALEGE